MSITELSKMQITELKQAYLAQLAENVGAMISSGLRAINFQI